jgi:hypothetical protein
MGPLEEVFQIPGHDAPCFYVSHSFVDGVLERTKFPGLRQQISGRRLPHFLRQQFKGFDSFFDG